MALDDKLRIIRGIVHEIPRGHISVAGRADAMDEAFGPRPNPAPSRDATRLVMSQAIEMGDFDTADQAAAQLSNPEGDRHGDH